MEPVKRSKSVLFGLLPVIFTTFLATGCASEIRKPLPLTRETSALDLQKESIALFTIKTSNQYKADYQPYVANFSVRTNDGKEKQETHLFLGGVGLTAKPPKPYSKVEKQFNDYLLSMSLPAGKYKLSYIGGWSHSGIIRGYFAIPVFADFELAPNKIVYLGRIEAMLRERKNDGELRGGSVFPLIDQAATGFSSGTFDINIYDNYEKDVSLFKDWYPVLDRLTIEKAVLLPWKQPTEEELKD